MAEMNWAAYNLPAIWEMLKHEDVCNGADRVLSWDALAQDMRDQHKRLLAAKEALEEAWPTKSNESAEYFMDKISTLAQSMTETMTKAEDTRAGLQGVINALATAQSTISPLVELRAKYADDWIPRMVDHAEDDYDHQAQQAMNAAESAVRDHSTQIQAPNPFFMAPKNDSTGTDLPEDPKSGHGSHSADPDQVRAAPRPVVVPHNPPDLSSGPNREGSGPTLTGLAPLAPVAPVGPPQSSPVNSLPIGGGQSGFPPGLGPGLIIRGGASVTPGSGPGAGARGPVGGPGTPGARVGSALGRQQVSVRRGLPSGATIGATSSEGELAQGRGGAGQSMIGGQPHGQHDRRKGGTTSALVGEGDVQWSAAEGVAPVIAPDRKKVVHDPGPGVIGLDR